MKIIRNHAHITEDLKHSTVTVGNFDGIHLGHQFIFRKMVDDARDTSSRTVVVTFEPHPQKVLHPERRPFYLLTTLDEKAALIEGMGIDALLVVDFTRNFAKKSPEEFVKEFLWESMNIKRIYVGYDNAFGRDKSGDAKFLKKMGRRMGFGVREIEAVRIDGQIVSSSSTRISIMEGKLDLASRMLGRDYELTGTIIRGYSRGKAIGVPTANIETEKVIPANGVYAVRAELNGTEYGAVLNVGFNPTFANPERSVEVHLLDFSGEIYGDSIKIRFIQHLRNEITFGSAKLLVEQIRKDIERARNILYS